MVKLAKRGISGYYYCYDLRPAQKNYHFPQKRQVSKIKSVSIIDEITIDYLSLDCC